MAAVESEQLVIDGLPVAERRVSIKGDVAVPADVLDALLGGEEIDVRVITRLVTRNQSFTRNQWGDDEAGVKLVLEVNQTKRVKRVDPDLTEDTRALARSEREAEREAERREFEREQEEFRRQIEAEEQAHADGGELGAKRRAALEAGEPSGDASDPRATGEDAPPEPDAA